LGPRKDFVSSHAFAPENLGGVVAGRHRRPHAISGIHSRRLVPREGNGNESGGVRALERDSIRGSYVAPENNSSFRVRTQWVKPPLPFARQGL